MTKKSLRWILIVICIFLTGCATEARETTEMENKENEMDTVIDNNTAINYSDDENANIF